MLFAKKKTKTVMILMTDKHLGNLVVSLPAIHELMEFFKESRRYLVVDSSYIDIAGKVKGPEDVICYPRTQVRGSPAIERVWKFLKFAVRLKRLSPDITIDLNGRQVSGLLTLIAGSSLRIGSASADWPYFYNKKAHVSSGKHRMYRYLDIASAAGAGYNAGNFRLQAGEPEKISLKTKLSGMGIGNEAPIVCIHPGAGKVFKEWMSEGFAEIADWLSAKGYRVMLVGGAGDVKKIHEVLSLSGSAPCNLGGRLSLGELIALLETSSLYIGNDTGPLHIAAAVGSLPVIGLFFRPGTETRWYPVARKSVVLKSDAGCHDCKGKHCEYDFKCTRMISSEDVKKAVEKMMADEDSDC